MKIHKYKSWILLAASSVAMMVSAVAPDACGEDVVDRSVKAKEVLFKNITSLRWRLPRGARIDGDVLTVEVITNRPSTVLASADIDLSEYNSKGFEMQIDAWAEDLAMPNKEWLGFKFMVSYSDPTTGVKCYPGAHGIVGTFQRRKVGIIERTPTQGRIRATLHLGIQGATGVVHFDLSTLRIRPRMLVVSLVNQDFKIKYPDSVSQLPVLRGVMLPGKPCKEKDIADLSAWGATLARCQMVVSGDESAYDKNIAHWLEWLEKSMLGWSRRYGIRLIIDLHTPPGGRYGGSDTGPRGTAMPNDLKMLYEEKLCEKFVETWRMIAHRLKGNQDVIYGYDLCNEPVQRGHSIVDHIAIQRLAAEAVRAIDSETTIVIEAGDWANPEAFEYLSPIRMDNVIYQFHMYRPHQLTHQRVGGDRETTGQLLPYPCPGMGWDKHYLRSCLQPVVAFQRKHAARILVGEFSCVAWTPGAEQYLSDVIDLFEEYGWDWTYHAFREWDGWSVEHDWRNPREKAIPSKDNPRQRVLRERMRPRGSGCHSPKKSIYGTQKRLLLRKQTDSSFIRSADTNH